MELYEYLIGGKKTGRIDDLKDPMPGSKPFCDLKTGEPFFVSQFKPDGTHVYVAEIKITSIHKSPSCWVFTGFAKNGVKYTHFVEKRDLNKTFYVDDPRAYYTVFSTFEMDDKPFFELVKKEIKNSKK